jgi:hypothetical protein
MIRYLIAATLTLGLSVAYADNVPTKPKPVSPEKPVPLHPDPAPTVNPP